jgi:hypothetical protein
MRVLTVLVLIGILCGGAVIRISAQGMPQGAAPADPKIAFEVSLATTQREFQIGETIPLQLSFSSTVKDRYQINMAQYDRSGRMPYETFTVSPAQGAVDPLPTYNNGGMGGLTNFQFLSPEPWTTKLNLNEWLRFTQPGDYRVIVSSSRVGVRDRSKTFGSSPVTARSNEIRLKIVAADAVWQKQTFKDAVTKLAVKSGNWQEDVATRRQAAETLRFLGTDDAVSEMATRMRGENSGELDYIFMLGLIATPDRSVARAALAEALADSNHPIDHTFLYTLSVLKAEPGAVNANSLADQQRSIEDLVAALSNKRGKALSASLSTAVNAAWNANSLPQQTTDKLVGQLLSLFDQLPPQEQNTLLTQRWDKIKSPALLPLLRRYAQSYQDFPELRESKAYESLQLSASALRHWYELDPTGARPAIITEISRPRPRFSARVLGLLPDETLPEIDFVLAEHFAASDDLDGTANLAGLIARYATAAILPQITEKLDGKLGKWACAIQDPILAYLLRVNPAMARPRIEQAIAARGPEFSACNHEIFQGISEIHYDPVLEELGVQSLDGSDPQVAMTAATMLGKFGSPAAESALWRRYARWTAQSSGRQSQLEIASADRPAENDFQNALGQNLLQALATGNSWLSDKSTLERLSQLTKVRQVQEQLDRYLKLWDEQPLTVFIDPGSSPIPFHARVAQYEFQSLDALKEKLAQFPSGTKFLLSTSSAQSSADEQRLGELRAFLVSHGMSLAEPAR